MQSCMRETKKKKKKRRKNFSSSQLLRHLADSLAGLQGRAFLDGSQSETSDVAAGFLHGMSNLRVLKSRIKWEEKKKDGQRARNDGLARAALARLLDRALMEDTEFA